MPGWWGERRYGIYLDVSLATVPGWAPIGASAERYRSHLGEVAAEDGAVPDPLVEVLAHHRDRWGHLASYDDFAPLLDFEQFDAEEWAGFVVRCGAGYAALTARHDDGWCWWDAPHASKTVLEAGPRRDVVADFATACERNDLVLGAFYSLATVPGVAGERGDQMRDLIDRVGIELLFSDIGTHAAGPRPPGRAVDGGTIFDAGDFEASGAGGPVLDQDIAASLGREAAGRIISFAYDPPINIVAEPWQLCRPVGASLCHNRTETAAHQLSAVEIVVLLTEVIAKGGNLLLGIGPTAQGAIAGPATAPLLGAADWIGGHDHLLRNARPWSDWGDADAHYWVADGALYVADIAGEGRFAKIGADDHVVERIGHASPTGDGGAPDETGIPFEHDAGGVQLTALRPRRGRRQMFPVVYRIETSPRERAGELFAPTAQETIPLAPLLANSRRGEILQLGDAVYDGPAMVPPGVTLRGLGPDRTRVATADGPITLDDGARLEHLAVGSPTGSSPGPVAGGLADADVAQVVVAGDGAVILGCALAGSARIVADEVTIRATRLELLQTRGAHGPRIAHCQFAGGRWSTAIEVIGGSEAEIDSCEFIGYRRAVHVVESPGVAVAGNHIESRHCGVYLERAERGHVHGNLITATMRAVDVDGGSHAIIDGNAVFDGDSGCVVRGGATDCEISGNHWERCRIGVLGWNAGEIREIDNHGVDLYEPDQRFVIGP